MKRKYSIEITQRAITAREKFYEVLEGREILCLCWTKQCAEKIKRALEANLPKVEKTNVHDSV